MVKLFALPCVALTLLTSNDTLVLDSGSQLWLFLLIYVYVFLGEGKFFLSRRLLGKRNAQLVSQIAISVEINAPPQLVAEDLGDLEVLLKIGAQYALKVFFEGQFVDSLSFFVVKFAGGELKVDHEVDRFSAVGLESVQLDVAAIHNGVHSHSEQVDHHLDKDVLFDSHIAWHVRIHIDTQLDAKLLRIVVCHAAHLIETGTDIDALKHRLCKVVLRHIVNVLEIPDAVPRTSHHRQAVSHQVKLLLVTASFD